MKPLQQPHFTPFPIASLSPKGWLADQLRLQAGSLSGHLDTFWPDIKDSAWIGGEAEGWERMPYWLDGVIPLAWLIDDATLKARITGYLDTILTQQHADGWLGPRAEVKKEAADVWSQALALKMLTVYHDASGDERVPNAVEKGLRMLDRHIDEKPLEKWGHSRWFEFLIAIFWLYERSSEDWLLDLAVKLQAQGFSWKEFFQRWPLTARTPKGRWNYMSHVVNNVMAVKEGGLRWRLSGDDSDREAVHTMLAALDQYHGMPTGVFTGDECLAGTSATQGTELCSVVELMYSLEILCAAFGDTSFADRLERVTFNALPATFSPDMWSHQYDQQLNQVECSIHAGRPWTTNGPDSNLFGLEPHFGCCTSNLSQGWPKFAAHLWMQSADGGIAAMAYAPSKLTTAIDGVAVRIELQTDYPFKQQLDFTIYAESAVRFPLHLRIPAWAAGATLSIDHSDTAAATSGSFHTVDRLWEGETHIRLSLPMQPQILERPNGAISLSRGPLLYALPIGEDWRQVNEDKPHRELPHTDWEVRPTTPWNYALETAIDSMEFSEHALQSPVFSPNTPPISASIRGQRVPEWTMSDGSAGPTPSHPASSNEPLENLQLIPYGCTNLRIAEFPVAASIPRENI
jgi:hypothetical protein